MPLPTGSLPLFGVRGWRLPGPCEGLGRAAGTCRRSSSRSVFPLPCVGLPLGELFPVKVSPCSAPSPPGVVSWLRWALGSRTVRDQHRSRPARCWFTDGGDAARSFNLGQPVWGKVQAHAPQGERGDGGRARAQADVRAAQLHAARHAAPDDLVEVEINTTIQ